MTTPWNRSHPHAITDRLTAVPHAHRAAGRDAALPRTLRLPRVWQPILRDPIDQAAADVLDAFLARGHDNAPAARTAVALVNRLTAGRRLSHAAQTRVDRAVAAALTDQLNRLRPAAARADRLLAAAEARCTHCTAEELCTTHQTVLWKWFDLRDHAAITVVNAGVAALAVPPSPAAPSKRPGGPR